MAGLQPLAIRFAADMTSVSKTLKKATGSGGVFSKFGKAAGAAVAAGAGAALAAVAGAGKLAVETETVLSDMKRATGAFGDDATKQFEALRDAAREVPESFEEVGDAFSDLRTRLEGTDKEIAAVTEAILDFNRVGGGADSAKTVEGLGKALDQFGLDAGSVDLDALTHVTQGYGITADDLAETMAKVSTRAVAAGVGFDELALMIGRMHDAGLKGRDAGTLLDYLLAQMTESGLGLDHVLLRIQAGFVDLETVFGKTGGQKFVKLLQDGTLSLSDMRGELEGVEDDLLTKVVADTATAGEKMSEAWNKIKQSLIDVLLPAFEQVAEWINEWLPKITGWVETARDKIEEFVTNWRDKLTGLLDELVRLWEEKGPLVGAAAAVIGAVLVAVFAKIAIAAGAAAIAVVVALAPIIAIGAAIAGVGAAVVAAYQNWEGFRNVVDTVGRWFRDTFWPWLKDVGNWLRDNFIPIIQSVGSWFRDTLWPILKNVGGWIKDNLWPIFKDIGTTIGVVATAVGKTLVTAVQKITPVLTTLWAYLDEYILDILRTLAGVIQDTVIYAWNQFKTILCGVITFIKAVFTGDWKGAWTAVKDTFIGVLCNIVTFAGKLLGHIWDALKTAFKLLGNVWGDLGGWIYDRVKGGVEKILGWFKSLPTKLYNKIVEGLGTIGDKLKEFGKWVFDKIVGGIGDIGSAILDKVPGGGLIKGAVGAIGNLAGGASGGLVQTPTPLWVGEAGPELLIPLDDPRASRALGGMGGPPVVVNVFGGLDSSAAIGERVEEALTAWQARKGSLDFAAS